MTQHSGLLVGGVFPNLRLSCAIRDDPTIDEATRLRNRIAELESLVRELRGAYGVSYAISFFFFFFAALLPVLCDRQTASTLG